MISWFSQQIPQYSIIKNSHNSRWSHHTTLGDPLLGDPRLDTAFHHSSAPWYVGGNVSEKNPVQLH